MRKAWKELNKLGVKSEIYIKNIIEKFLDYIFGLQF